VAAQRKKSSRAQVDTDWPTASKEPAHDAFDDGLGESAPRESAPDGFDWLREQ